MDVSLSVPIYVPSVSPCMPPQPLLSRAHSINYDVNENSSNMMLWLALLLQPFGIELEMHVAGNNELS